MKKMNKKGFTLIELLAVIIILGVLMLIAVPSVSKYIQQSREKTYATNLQKLVDAVSTEVNSYTNADYQFSSNQYLVVPFICVELERGSNEKSPFTEYEHAYSYVVVERATNGFSYQVSAMDTSGYGTKLVDPNTLTKAVSVASTDLKKITKDASSDSYSVDLGIADKTSKVFACDAFKSKVAA